MEMKKAAPSGTATRDIDKNYHRNKDNKNIRYIKSKAVKALEQLADQAAREKYPMIKPEWLAPRKYRDDSANALTKCVIDFLRLKGWQAERISNTGRPVDGRKSFVDVMGNTRSIGRMTWIKGTGTKGTADISATVAGKSLKIEIKYGSDRQSPAQKQYQADVEKSGGIYLIVRDFAGFYEWYQQNIPA